MDYLEFFNLGEDPFRITPDPFYFYPSHEHNEILSSLNYAVEQKEGFYLATGEPGTGKTTILKVFLNNWKEKAEIALIMTPRLSPEEFLMALIEDLKIALNTKNKNEMIKSIRDFLVEHSSSGRRVIIIVDEAQNLPEETLEELRLLSNLETDKEKLLQIILIGHPELRTRLMSSAMRQLNQRITLRAALKPLTMSETADYVNYRLIKAGKGSVDFEEGARKLLFKESKGIPRMINLIASRAMMAAYLDMSRHVRKRHIVYATRHLLDEPLNYRARILPLFRSKPMLAVLIAAVTALVVIYGMDTGIIPAPGRSKEISAAPAAPLKQELPVKVEIITGSQPTQAAQEQKGPKVAVADAGKRIVVAVDKANLRSEPSLTGGTVSSAKRGVSFEVAGESADSNGRKWYRVTDAAGGECWIASEVVKDR